MAFPPESRTESRREARGGGKGVPTLPIPREVRRVLGHGAALEIFREAMQKGRLHHAWLICGPSGIGKASFAFALARLLLKADNHDTPAGRRVTAGTHGDLLEISRKTDPKKGTLRGEITVADVQPIQKFLHHTATEGGWRVVVVDGVEHLNRFAANALLKVLEEPPPKAVLLLTTSRPDALLPTLRSRCRSLVLSPLGMADMQALLPELSGDVLARAHGAPGRALFLAIDRDGTIAHLVAQAMAGALMTADIWHALGQVARQVDGMELFCTLLSEALGQKARACALGGSVAEAAVLAEKTAALAKLAYETRQANLDKAQALREAYALVTPLLGH